MTQTLPAQFPSPGAVTSAASAEGGEGRRRAGNRRSLEPWRDAAVIGVVTHLVLLVAVLAHPGLLATVLLAVPLAAVMSVGTLTVLHDAGHRMFGRTAWPNVVAVQLAVPAGLWVGHWTLKHRVHHKLSQVYPVDESTRSSSLLRLHAEAPVRPLHRYQHLYAWLLYSLAWVGELRSQLTYLRTGVVTGADTPGTRSRTASFLVEKLLWLAVLAPYAWLLGPARMAVLVVTAETFGSLLSAVVLVVGHVNVGLVDDPGTPRDWAAHLVRTTASFRTGSTVARYLTGGMTHHLAHHLRPAAVRSQLPALHRTAVRELVEHRGLQQSEYATFAAAVRDHYARLHELGAPSTLH